MDNNLKKRITLNLKSLGCNFIIEENFNVKNTFWRSRLMIFKGRKLFAAREEIKCYFHSEDKRGTRYWPTNINKISDLIDFFVIKSLFDYYIHVENAERLISDHSPLVVIIISKRVIKKENLLKLTSNQLKYLSTDNWRSNINLQVQIKDFLQLENEVELLVENVQVERRKASLLNKRKWIKISSSIGYRLKMRELEARKQKVWKKW